MTAERWLRNRPELRDLARLLGFVRPYAFRLVIALGFALLYSSGIMGRAGLLQPLLDQVVLPDAQGKALDRLPIPADEAPEEVQRSRAQLEHNVRENLERIQLAAFALVVLMPIARLGRDYSSDWLVTRLQVDLQQRVG